MSIAPCYNGYVYDDVLEVWHAGERNYNASDRRFMSEDPENGNVYELLRVNRYIYAGDNPVNYTDPTGRFYIGDAIGTFAKVYCEIENMPVWQKAVIGTAGAAVGIVAGLPAGAVVTALVKATAV